MRKLARALLICGVVLIISACSKSDKSGNSPLLPKDTIFIDIGGEPPTLDPALAGDSVSFRVLNDLFEGLVTTDQANKTIPALAESWTISPDGKIYIFTLRHGLKFSDGSPIFADDVIKSWLRFVDPKTGAQQSNLADNIVNGLSVIKGKLPVSQLGIKAQDPYHIIIQLNYPDSFFVDKLTSPGFSVVPIKIINKYGSSWTEPSSIVTSGAYRLTSHVVNGYLEAKKNQYYYDESVVQIPNIKYLAISDPNAAYNQYLTGHLDITNTIPIEQYKQIKVNYPHELYAVEQNAIYYYDLNQLDPLLKSNMKLRQALVMSVDRDSLVKYVLGQGQKPMYSFIPDTVADGAYKGTHYFWESWSYTKRLDYARKLYAEAGFSPAKPLTLTISYNTLDSHKKIALAIASMWQSGLGINVQLKNQEWKTFIKLRQQGNYQIARDGWIADNNVASFTEFMFLCGSAQNNSHYCNHNYDRLIQNAKMAVDPQQKQQFNQQAIKIALDDYPIVPLYQYVYLRLVSPRVEGYYPNGNHNDSVMTKWMQLKY